MSYVSCMALQEKYCSSCKKTKNLEDFANNSSMKDGKARWCKSCIIARYYVPKAKQLPDYLVEKSRLLENGLKKCARCNLEKKLKNFHRLKTTWDGWHTYCKDCRKEEQHARQELTRAYKRKHSRLIKHINAWRNSLRLCLRRLGKKKEAKTIDLLGYSAQEFKEHLESKWLPGMSWDNYGDWHIDHIRPLASFGSNDSIKVVHGLDNLQPLWAVTKEVDGVVYVGNLNKKGEWDEKTA